MSDGLLLVSRADAESSMCHDVYDKISQSREENRASLGGKSRAGMQSPLMHVYRAPPSPHGRIVICNFILGKNRFVRDEKH